MTDPRVATLALCASLAACGGEGGSESGGGFVAFAVGSEEAVDPGPEGYRIAVRRTDEDGDGSVDEVLSHAYDANGRIVSDTYERPDSGFSRTVVYSFDGELLVGKGDGTEAIAYAYADGRVQRITDSVGDAFDDVADYRYDGRGRLIGMTVTAEADDDGGEVGSGGDEPALEVSELEFAYENGRLVATIVRDRDGGAVLTRYDHDGRGFLTGAESTGDGIAPAPPSDEGIGAGARAVLSYDAEGRLATIRRERPGDRESLETFSYEGDRLVSVRLDGRRAEVRFVLESSYAYSPVGLVESVTTVFTLDDDGSAGSSSVTVESFEYENGSCIGRPSARPELNLIAPLVGYATPGSALRCGYWLDGDL